LGWHPPFIVLLALAALAPVLRSQTIPNPSFESNAAFAAAPGYISGNAAIVGWTASPTDHVGLNPAGGQNDFANNGAVPSGTRVAFLQGVSGVTSVLSTTITGLVSGTTYRVQFRANMRDGFDAPRASLRLNGGAPVSFAASPAVGVSNAYYTITGFFTATGATAGLEIDNANTNDSAVLLDNFTIAAVTTIQVTTLDNDGPGSLRQALLSAAVTSAPNVITFAATLSGQTIALLNEIPVNDTGGVVIDASSLSAGLTISGGNNTRLFSVPGGSTLVLRKLTLTGGNATGNGGAIANQGTLSLAQCTLNGNIASADGGAIINDGQLDLLQCTLTGNNAGGDGGAIFNRKVLTLTHCTISGNSATGNAQNVASDSSGDPSALLTVANSIIAGHDAGSFDLVNNDPMITVGANVIVDFQNNGTLVTGAAPLTSDPKLDTLANNGGPSKTIALLPGSSARNAAVGSVITTDQRGKPKVGVADIGAFEIQSGGAFAFSQIGYSVLETAGSAIVRVVRGGNFDGAASVKISTMNGTATSADFTGITNQVVSFADGDLFKDVPIAINKDGVDEANETFTVTLSSPSSGASLGTPASAKVSIIDPTAFSSDITKPGVPVISSPAAGATVNALNGGAILISGTASDNKGVHQVQIRVATDGGAPDTFTDAVLDTPDGATTGWSAFVTPVAGPNSVEVKSIDNALFESDVATRAFKVLHPLAVQIVGGGSVTSGFTPSSFREVGQRYVITATPAATPAPGNIFQSWTIESGQLPEDVGVPQTALEKPTLNFIHRDGLVLRANFVPNPYVALGSNAGGVSGVDYNGLIHADPGNPAPNGSPRNNSTEGLLTVNLMSNGAFSGKFTIDGTTLSVAGAFDQNGAARFGTSRAMTVAVPRVNKPSLVVSLSIDLDPSRTSDTVFGVVTATSFQRSVVQAVSTVTADRAFYDGLTGATTVPGAYLGTGSATQSYTMGFTSLPLGKGTATLYGGTFDDLMLLNASDGEIIMFVGTAPIGLLTDQPYTLVDELIDGTFFTLQDSNGDPAPIDSSYDDTSGVPFDVVLDPSNHQDPALTLTTEDYPQGDGYGFITISKSGVVMLTAGKLADGSNWTTFATKLTKDNRFPIFLQLYNKLGYLGGDMQLDSTDPNSDFAAVTRLDWTRPSDFTSQYYPYGWHDDPVGDPLGKHEVINVGCFGAKYFSSFTPASSVLRQADDALGGDPDQIGDPLLPDDPVNGNAKLSFFDGQLTEQMDRTLSVSSTNAVTRVPASDTSFSLTITSSTGRFSGTFVHENDDGVPNPLTTGYEGVIYQKGPNAGGYGFFLTRKPNPIDYTGESGNVNLFGFIPTP
jgi:hypothetical protein